MKRIAIIGSGSFLARNFIKYSIDNGFDYQFELYDYCMRDEWPEFKFTKISFEKQKEVEKIDFSADVLMIYIGKTGTTIGFEDYKSFIEVNEIMLLNILRAYVNANSKAKIVYPSSRLMFRSDEKNRINENSIRECKSIYAITKQAAEEYLKIYKDSFDVNSVVIRICTPIGTLLKDYGNYGTFEIFKNQAIEKHEITIFGDGLQRKTFTLMEDICKAFSLIINSDRIKFFDYNLGGQELSLLDIANQIAKEYKVPIKHIPWPDIYKKVDGGSVVFDSTRFDEEFHMLYRNILNKDLI